MRRAGCARSTPTRACGGPGASRSSTSNRPPPIRSPARPARSRVAWTVIGTLPVIQCVQVKRTRQLPHRDQTAAAVDQPADPERSRLLESILFADGLIHHQTERHQPHRRGLAGGPPAAPQRPGARDRLRRRRRADRDRGRRARAAPCAGRRRRGARSQCRRRQSHAGRAEGCPARSRCAARPPTWTCCRVRLDEKIRSVVPIELSGVDDAPGVKQGGVLEQITRELEVEALPTAIPESIVARGRRDGDRRHDHAVRAGGARGRDAPRRPRGDRAGDPVPAQTADRSRRGNRVRDRARGRGRRAARRPRRVPRRAPPARSSGRCGAPSVVAAVPSTG